LKKEYWSITADLLTQSSEPLSAKLWTVSGLKVVTRPDTEGDRKDRYWIKDSEEAERIAGELSDESVYKVARVEKKEKKRNPQPPFITSTMQREAAVRFGWPARKTMQVAQSLYEGVELGAEGATGLITYMRTDSTRLADSAVAEARKLILADYGERFLPKKPKSYTTKKGKIQDAHEAIRPTSAYRRPDKMKPFLNSDQARLYRLIWSRFVACQMTAAVYDQTTVDIAAGDGGSYILRVTGSVMRFTGFTAVYIENLEKETSANGERNGEDNLLPELEKGDILNLVKISPRQHFTQPPPRFTESSLIRELEANGIGRPSTYASIMSTILDKGYVQRLKGALKPTDLGFAVNGLLVERFPSILNVKFTARMESMLDHVEEGRQDWLKILEEFYGDFKPLLENALSQRKKVTVETDVVCDKCGAKMAIRWSRHGEFLGCSAYPECKNIKQFERDDEGRIKITGQEVTEHKCSKCGSPMVRKNGRYGPFLSCSRYPECKEIKPLSTGIPCPKKGCDGEITEKKTKRGKTFYSCTRYPECDFASWDRPLDYSCTNCGARPVYEKSSRAGGKYIQCKECRTRLKEEDLAREAEGSQGS
ncbi:MAG: type I DNA topoisomerase, partial [Gemmatimonadota bacterium]|nr:type I DNA topoisomerase [Gemmatimonadota bacterium]